MLSLGAIIRATPRSVWRRAPTVQVKLEISRWGTDTTRGPYFEAAFSVKSRRPIRGVQHHEVWRCIVRQFGKDQLELARGGISTKRLSWIWCSCPSFLYNWEVALTAVGSSNIVDSNGEKPVIRNPAMKPGCCKHQVALTVIQPNLKLPPPLDKKGRMVRISPQDRERSKLEDQILKLLGK